MKHVIMRMFKRGNVLVVGERGAGKDVLIGNVYARMRYKGTFKPYVSNQDYGSNCIADYKPKDFDMNGNTYKDLIGNDVKEYIFPYPMGTDVIISDGGIYFPSQYCNELNRDYKGQPMFSALSRQLGRCNVHVNTQAYGRLWDKFREQAFRFIQCEWCFHFMGIVFQQVIVYDRAETCQARVKPCRVTVPLMGDKNARMQAKIYRDTFYNQHGMVKRYTLIYREKSKHNTYQFERKFRKDLTIYEEVDTILRPRSAHMLRTCCKRIGFS